MKRPITVQLHQIIQQLNTALFQRFDTERPRLAPLKESDTIQYLKLLDDFILKDLAAMRLQTAIDCVKEAIDAINEGPKGNQDDENEN